MWKGRRHLPMKRPLALLGPRVGPKILRIKKTKKQTEIVGTQGGSENPKALNPNPKIRNPNPKPPPPK